MQARIVLTTVASVEDARRVGGTLVEEGLVACATMIPAVESVYRWEGKVERATEILLLLKTGSEQLTALEKRLHELHPYKTPECIVLPVEGGSEKYLAWMEGVLSIPGK